MRELRTTKSVMAKGTTEDAIAWAIKQGRWTHIIHGVLGRGPEPPSALDAARATAVVSNGIADDTLSAVLQNFDGVELGAPRILVPRKASARRAGLVRTTKLPGETVLVDQVRCVLPDATLRHITKSVDDLVWEQAMEFCLRKRHVTPGQLLEWSRTNKRVRHVLAARGGLELPPTDSLLETLAIQLIRTDPSLPMPTRQYRIIEPATGRIVARVDLCWPLLGLFLELDGQQHKDQPVYDAVRQNRVTAITRWRCARLTWDQVTRQRDETLRELRELLFVR